MNSITASLLVQIPASSRTTTFRNSSVLQTKVCITTALKKHICKAKHSSPPFMWHVSLDRSEQENFIINLTEQSIASPWQVAGQKLTGKIQSFLTEQVFLLLWNLYLFHAQELNQQFFNFCPFPLRFCVTALTKGLLRSCLQPHYTLNSEHERGQGNFLS